MTLLRRDITEGKVSLHRYDDDRVHHVARTCGGRVLCWQPAVMIGTGCAHLDIGTLICPHPQARKAPGLRQSKKA
jgi:hypothetical protein